MLGEAQGEHEDGSARGLPAPLAAANKGKKCRGQGPPEPQRCPPPCPLPNFAAWMHSVQAAWTEVAALQPCQTGASSSLILMGILSRRAPPCTPEIQSHPKGPGVISTSLWGNGAAKTSLCHARALEVTSRQGSPCPAIPTRPRDQLGAPGAPGHPWGLGDAAPPPAPAPCPAQPVTGGQWDRHQHESCSLGAPKLAPQVLPLKWGPPGGGKTGALTPHHPWRVLSPPRTGWCSLYPMLRAKFPSHPQSWGCYGAWGRGRQSRAVPCTLQPWAPALGGAP